MTWPCLGWADFKTWGHGWGVDCSMEAAGMAAGALAARGQDGMGRTCGGRRKYHHLCPSLVRTGQALLGWHGMAGGREANMGKRAHQEENSLCKTLLPTCLLLLPCPQMEEEKNSVSSVYICLSRKTCVYTKRKELSWDRFPL